VLHELIRLLLENQQLKQKLSEQEKKSASPEGS